MNDIENRFTFRISTIQSKKKQDKNTMIQEKRNHEREDYLMKKRKQKNFSDLYKNHSSKIAPESLINLFKLKKNLISDEIEKKKALIELRKLLSVEKNPPIQQIIDLDLVCIFVDILKNHTRTTFQFEAAWILTNIASGTTEQTLNVINCGAVPVLIELIEHEHDNLKEQALWALGNIAGDSYEYRNLVLDNNVLSPIMKQISLTDKISFLRIATWTLSNLCRGKPRPDIKYTKIMMEALQRIVFSEDDQVLTDVCWALSYISEERPDFIIDSEILQRIVELLLYKDFYIQTPALRIIGNIVTGDEIQTQLIINCSVLPCLSILLNSSKKAIKKEACWAISNIAAGNFEQIQTLIDCDVFPVLIHILKNSEIDIKKEACWGISNAILGGKKTQIEYLVKQGCTKPMLELIDFVDTRLIRVILESIENILKVTNNRDQKYSTNAYIKLTEQAEIVEKLEILQHHKNENIYKKSTEILENYFEVEEFSSTKSEQRVKSSSNFHQKQQLPQCFFNLN